MDELESARLVLLKLASGVSPLTGEVLPAGAYTDPLVTGALQTALEAIEFQRRNTRDAIRFDTASNNVGKPWSPEDDRVLLGAIAAGRKSHELARELGRTRFGVEVRMQHLAASRARQEFTQFVAHRDDSAAGDEERTEAPRG